MPAFGILDTCICHQVVEQIRCAACVLFPFFFVTGTWAAAANMQGLISTQAQHTMRGVGGMAQYSARKARSKQARPRWSRYGVRSKGGGNADTCESSRHNLACSLLHA